MYKLPEPSSATSQGLASVAAVGEPPSPPMLPPAIVAIVPAVTERIRWLPVSDTRRFPDASAKTPTGPSVSAPVAAVLSPVNPSFPLESTRVLITLLPLATQRIRFELVSAI